MRWDLGLFGFVADIFEETFMFIGIMTRTFLIIFLSAAFVALAVCLVFVVIVLGPSIWDSVRSYAPPPLRLDFRRSSRPSKEAAASRSAPRTDAEPSPHATKTVAESSVTAAYTVHSYQGDGAGRAYAGELLKLIDVVAGIACRKHADAQCVTISLDRVIFLSPLVVGDIVHLSVSINRAWGSSMEAGVRIMKEDAQTGKRSYACHAYLTFVARAPPALPSTISSHLPWPLSELPAHPTSPSKPPPFQVPQVKPVTVLEHKRYLLAGRRRGHRMKRRQIWDSQLSSFRDYVLSFPASPHAVLESERMAGQGELKDIEMELVAEGYLKGDEDVRVEAGQVIAEVEGFMDRVSFPLKDIEKFIASRGTGSFRRLSLPRTTSDSGPSPNYADDADPNPRSYFRTVGGVGEQGSWELDACVEMQNTISTSVQIVRPQHCNSQGVLFGGELMRWLEEVALLSARHIAPVSWSTATVDSMTFRASAHPGYIVSTRSVVLKVWDSSIECYVVATAVDRTGQSHFVSDAFFSLVALDRETNRPQRGKLKRVLVPEGEAKGERMAREMVEKAGERREARLQDKRMLQKVYS